MIDLLYWPTPNGWKISIALEEMELAYRMIPVDIGKGAQFEAPFLAVSPNNRIPAIVDHDPEDGGPPVSVFESGAVLVYLAEKTGRFLPRDPRGRSEVVQWLMWQMGGLGPMLGQHGHFKLYAREPIAYAIERYRTEAERLYGVLDRRLADREFIAGGEAAGPRSHRAGGEAAGPRSHRAGGEAAGPRSHRAGAYSIADMACWPWVVTHKAQEIDLAAFPHVRRWYDALKERPALRRGYELGRELRRRAG